MFYFVYCTTNLVNGNIYIGTHQTKNLEDSYLGSGVLINRAINKYGRKNFKREILKMFDSSKEAYLFEAEIVNQNFISRPNVYNLVLGGTGGSILHNRKPFTGKHSEETKKKISKQRTGTFHSKESKELMSKNSWSKKIQFHKNSMQ